MNISPDHILSGYELFRLAMLATAGALAACGVAGCVALLCYTFWSRAWRRYR